MNTRMVGAIAPLLLAAAAGLAQTPTEKPYQPPNTPDAPAQPAMRDRPSTDQDRDRDAMRTGDKLKSDTLIKGKNVIGAKVVNKANESLGKIDDVLIETRNGYAVYGVLTHGGVLGIGDKLVAIPWNALQVLPTSDGDATVVLDMTKDRLKAAPNFDKDQWPLIGEHGWMEKTHTYYSVEPSWTESGTGGWGRDSALIRDWKAGRDLDFKGRIDKVERRAPARGMSEGFVLTVQGDDRQEHTVFIGPAWYFQSQAANFKEGDEIEIHGREMKFRDASTLHAREVVLKNGGRLTLRDAGGVPVWDTMTPADARANGGGNDMFVRFSELKGIDVLGTGDNKVADVREAAINPGTGKVPFLVLGVGGLAGMGEREVVVPWRSLRFAKQGAKMAINADENTLKNAPQLDKAGFAMLNDPAFRQRVNAFYGDNFSDGTARMSEPGGWSTSSEYNKLFTGETETIKGTITNVQNAPPMKGMSDAVVVTIHTDSGDRKVHLGPAWFLNRQDLRLNTGDTITIKGAKASVQGDDVVIASEIQTSSGTLRLRDSKGMPNWDALRPGDRPRGEK